MVSPTRRREAVKHLVRRFHVSERRACKVLDQHRSTQRYEAVPADYEQRLVIGPWWTNRHQLLSRLSSGPTPLDSGGPSSLGMAFRRSGVRARLAIDNPTITASFGSIPRPTRQRKP